MRKSGEVMDQEYLIRKIEKYADEKGIPIMEKEGMVSFSKCKPKQR